jgi:dipeptidyl-peptidase-3
LKYKEIVAANRRPRRIDVQPDVKLNQGKVEYVKYEPSTYGCIDSGVAHFSENIDDIINEWEKNNQEFIY